ncbi:hypothetical protein [Corallococcus exiguus]|uniref:hypothetical protein n=1 Tax=Corallococcus exiguus TaxID=83462 RepID=UPI001494F0AC|nr:hypothetical protein [Corallococcus exiguus]NPD26389.1 hypothetical protein [Corallococcus exiguus]
MSAPGTWKVVVLRELEAVSRMPPANTEDAWRLAWAIGHARALLSLEPDIRGPLQTAEALLASHLQEVERQLEGRLRVEPLLAGLEAALQDGMPEEAQDRLLALEDVLVVCEVLGFQSDLERVLSEVSRQLAHPSSTLSGFDALARQRQEASGPAAHQLWGMVSTAASKASAQPLPASVERWFVHLDRVRAHVAQGLSDLVETLNIHSAEARPLVALGQEASRFDVHVEGRCPPDWNLRLFIVDAAHPDGEALHEGADYRRQGEHWYFDSWQLHGRDDLALLVAVAAPALPDAPSLAGLLGAIDSRSDVLVAESLLSPPSA